MAISTTAAAPDQATRHALLDAARVPVEADLGKPVKFRVDRLKVEGSHAFLLAHLEEPGGKPLDYAGTRLAGAAAEGFASHRYAALLKRDGERWVAEAFAIGPGDIAWSDWAQKYRAPPSLFAQ